MKISEELKGILLMQKDCPVSKKILELENDDNEFINGIGYLSVAYDNPSLLSYITEDRKVRFMELQTEDVDFEIGRKVRLKKRTDFIDINHKHWEIKEGQVAKVLHCDYRTIDVSIMKSRKLRIFKDCSKSYFIQDVIITKYLNPWNKDSRIKHAFMARSGKVLNKLFNEGLFSKLELEAFSRLFFSNNNPLGHRGLHFRVVSGSDIRKYYNQKNYISTESGSLGCSCMRYDRCGDFFGIYTDNDNVKMLILEDRDGLIHGRALLWHNVTINDEGGLNFMDRIYVTNYKDEEVFKSWALDNNYAYKEHQSTGDCGIVIHGNKVDNCKMLVSLENVYFDHYPYVDTFTNIDRDAGVVVSDSGSHLYDTLEMTNFSEGTLEGDEQDTVYSEYHDEDIPEDEAYWSDYHNSYLWSDRATWSSYYSDYISDDIAIKVKISGIWHILSSDDYDSYRECCVDDICYGIDEMFYCEIDDNWYHESNTSVCPVDNETYPTCMMVEASDGEMVYDGNLEEYEESILVREEEMEEVNG